MLIRSDSTAVRVARKAEGHSFGHVGNRANPKRCHDHGRDEDGEYDDEESCQHPERDVLIDETELGQYDVVCGRSKTSFNNCGNRRFRITISVSLPRYMAAPSRKDKSVVIQSVTDLVQGNGGRFLQQYHKKPGCGSDGRATSTRTLYYELSKKQSRLKVGHALRDMALAVSRSEAAALRQPSTSSSAPSPQPTTAKETEIDDVNETESNDVNETESNDVNETESDDVLSIATVESPKMQRRGSNDSILSDSVFENLVQLVAETNGSHHSRSSMSMLLDGSTDMADDGASAERPIPSTISVQTVTNPTTDDIITTQAGRDSLDANILSWLVDESSSLLDWTH